MFRRRQGGRRTKTLFGGRGVLRVVAGGKRQRRNPDGQPNPVAHDGSLQIPPYTAESPDDADGVGLNFA